MRPSPLRENRMSKRRRNNAPFRNPKKGEKSVPLRTLFETEILFSKVTRSAVPEVANIFRQS